MNQMIPIGKLFDLEKGQLQSSKCTAGDYNFITAAENWKSHKTFDHDCEALVFAAAASGSLGRTHHVNGKFIASDLCFILTPRDTVKYPMNLEFYHFVFNSLRPIIVAATKSGTSKESINQKNFKRYELPYFDIEQQALWIEKLKSTLDQKKQLDSELSYQKHLLIELRQQILQDAVEGTLTAEWRKENADIEPASDLLNRIATKKEQLVKEKKIKKQKPLPAITEKEKPFPLPKSWEWCRLGHLLTNLQYGTSKKCSYDNKQNTPILRIPNVSSGFIDTSDLKYTNLSTREKQQYSLEKDDLLIIRSNGSRKLVGLAVHVGSNSESFGYAGYLIRIRPTVLINSLYLKKFFTSPYIRASIETPLRTTVGINNINSTELSNLLIPLPPLEEQKAIVAKVEALFAICDQLEAQIAQNQEHTNQLMQAVLKEAFTHAEDEIQAIDNVVELKPAKGKQADYYKRTLLAAEIVDQLHKEPTFGHLKLQKMIFLCQKTQDMELPTNFLQQAAGPYDPKMARSLDKQLKEKQWYDYNSSARLKYKPLDEAGTHKDDYQKYFQEDLESIKHLIGLFKTKKSNEMEAVATLYACWEEILNVGSSFTKKALIEKFFAWSEEKRKFSERQLNQVIAWMEKHGIHPKEETIH